MPKPLFEAATKDDLATVKHLATDSVTLHERDEHGATALHWAGSLRVVEALLASGADANLADNEGKTPLYWHASEVDLVRALLAAGAEPKIWGKVGGSTPLHQAAGANAAESVKLLIAAGAPVESLTSTASYYPGRTPLHEAAEKDAVDAVKALLDLGADLEASDHGREGYEREGGETALNLAVQGGHVATVRFLLDRGAAPHASSNDGRTPSERAEDSDEEISALFR